ncbi:MAG: phosphoglycerate kinase [Longimicrobiales bacterium]
MDKKTIKDLPEESLRGKTVLVRVDYNVPLDNGRIDDDTRITATQPTLKYLLGHGAAIILVSHLGRPKGKPNADMSLAPVAERLSELLGVKVAFAGDLDGAESAKARKALKPGDVLLLENARFLPGEEDNDAELSDALADMADIYVNDAFGTAHRAHASTEGVAVAMKRNGKPAVAGFLIEKELRFLGGALSNPERPFTAILGGAKISGKIDVIEKLLPQVEYLLIGGAMANTFFRALGLSTGKSLVEEDRIDMARQLLERAGPKIVLPVDCVVAGEPKGGLRTFLVDRDAIPPEGGVYDIGPKSVATFRDFIERSCTILWNGPMGMFEVEEYAEGTTGVALAVVDATASGATTIIGGGDTASAIEHAGLADKVTHVSTGGGASLEFLEGRALPGIDILDDKEPA